jgi:hypothetical protein
MVERYNQVDGLNKITELIRVTSARIAELDADIQNAKEMRDHHPGWREFKRLEASIDADSERVTLVRSTGFDC